MTAAGVPPARALTTAITHTLNVFEPVKGYFSAAERCVTKYVIHVMLADGVEWHVVRRYSHFRTNHAALSAMFPQLRLPKLPPKILNTSQLPDPEVAASRMVLLDAYLKQLLGIAAIAGCTQMRTFLGAYQGMQITWFGAVSQRTTPTDEEVHPAIDAFAALTFGSSPARTSSGSTRASEVAAAVAAASSTDDPPPLEANLPYARADAAAAVWLIDHLGLPMNVDAFAQHFDTAGYLLSPDAAAAMAHRFLNGMEAAIAVSHPERTAALDGSGGVGTSPSTLAPPPPSCTEGVLWAARDLLEDRLLHTLHDAVFGVLPDEAGRDEELHRRLSNLEGVLRNPEEQLDVAPAFCDMRFNRWDAAANELHKLRGVRTARAMMDCVMRCVLQLKQGLVECLAAQGGRGTLGADELFPVRNATRSTHAMPCMPRDLPTVTCRP